MNWNIKRWLRHEFTGKGALGRLLPSESMDRLTKAIAESEKRHSGELRLVVECALDWPLFRNGPSPRDRAIQVFSELRVWDTEANNGVLIYLLLADHDIEIVADRGIDKIVGASEWERICHAMEAEFRQHRFEEGIRQGLAAITEHLERHFPHREGGVNHNELPDAPHVM